MEIYRISRRDKTWKDKKNITLYHISPDRIGKFMPKSSFRGKYRGVYFSPSYRSLIIDWAYYVKNKKEDKHPLNKLHTEVVREIRLLTEKVSANIATDEEKQKLEHLDEKLDRINSSMSRDTFEKDKKHYQTLYIYTVSCPPDVYKEVQDIYYGTMKEESEKGELSYGFWGWGAQVFIPDYLLDQIKIIDVRKIDSGELSQELSDSYKKPRHYSPTKENEYTGNWSQELENKRQEEKRLKIEKDERDIKRQKVRNLYFKDPDFVVKPKPLKQTDDGIFIQ